MGIDFIDLFGLVDQAQTVVLLETEDESIAQNLPPVVLGDMIRYLSRTFDIPVTDFYFSKTHPVH